MLGHMRLGSETRPPVYSTSVALPTNPAPSYDSGVGYTNGTLQGVQSFYRCVQGEYCLAGGNSTDKSTRKMNTEADDKH